jgi:hemerythrin-like domain-containing protein
MPATKTTTTKRTAATTRRVAKRTASTGRSAVKAGSKKAASAVKKTANRVAKPAKAASSRPSRATKSGGSRRRTSEPNALDLLKADHRKVEDLFARFEKTGPSAHKRRQQLVDSMIEELSIHAAVEEEVFYPAARREVAAAKDDVLEALEEHHVVKWTLSELERMEPTDERYAAKVAVLMDTVRHHVDEEEKQLFPTIRKALSAPRLRELGEELAAAKSVAPVRPHPEAPDTPPGNIISQAITAPFDAAASLTEATARQVRGLVT